MLINSDRWQLAHNYHWQRQNLLYQSLFQAGIVTGLAVSPIPPPQNVPAKYRDGRWLLIHRGIAIDAHSNFIIVSEPMEFRLANWEQNTVRPVAYPEIGGQDDYIQSMDVPEFRRNLLATADTKGFITVWDMTPCLKDTSQTCNIVDRWGDGHQGKPVRSVGIDPNGCYLVSGGDDGRLMFWGLTAAGRRAGEFANGKPLAVLNANVTAVDVRVQQHQVIAIAGDSTGRVRGYRQDRLPSLGCDR